MEISSKEGDQIILESELGKCNIGQNVQCALMCVVTCTRCSTPPRPDFESLDFAAIRPKFRLESRLTARGIEAEYHVIPPHEEVTQQHQAVMNIVKLTIDSVAVTLAASIDPQRNDSSFLPRLLSGICVDRGRSAPPCTT